MQLCCDDLYVLYFWKTERNGFALATDSLSGFKEQKRDYKIILIAFLLVIYFFNATTVLGKVKQSRGESNY